MRYLGIDYGSKKIGLAISDEEGKFAFPFSIIQNKNKVESLEKIISVIRDKGIHSIVVGESVNLKGENNPILIDTLEFVDNLKKIIDIKINFEKEWLSTLEARRYDDRRDADDSAAAIILQRFLDKEYRRN